MRFALVVVPALLFATINSAQAEQADRIPVIDANQTAVLRGSVPPKAQPHYDQGAVDPSMRLEYVTLQTQPTPQQQQQLQQLLAQQQDPSSPNYRKWLTPEQYADRFGLSRNDINKLTSWLQSQGFSIVQAARGRDWVAFSGTAGQVQYTFHTEIHSYNVNDERHFANAIELAIPRALAGVVAGIRGLDDFVSWRPMGIRPTPPGAIFPDILHPFYNVGGEHFLAPDDIATIYDIAQLYKAGIDGTGMKMVVVGQTDVTLTDLDAFRSGFGLSKNDPQVINLPGHTTSRNDLDEANLDLEWSGAVARNATIIYVNSPIPPGGAFNSAMYAIDQNLAPVISMSYGGCEQENEPSGFITFNEITMNKGSSEGITFLASSGDSGAAGCDPDTGSTATKGLAVVYPASSREVTGVGGTEFSGDVNNPGNFWGSNGTNLGSATQYISEKAWNDTALNGTLSATGGGASSCALPAGVAACSGFSKPLWQAGAGVPNDGVRDVPDVAMTASPDHDGYVVCSQGSCANGIANNTAIFGGTSASTPVFAGIMVLLNQKQGNRVGNVNPTLYKLAQNAANGVFHDVTTGDNKVPCTKGTTDCPNGGSIGYSATAGYDQVTGLGSVDANALVTGVKTTATTTALASSQNPASSGTMVTFTATVTKTGAVAPTGSVAFNDGSTALGNGNISGDTATFAASNLSVSAHSITAVYGGDSNNLPSTSVPLTQTITASGGSTTNTTVATNQSPQVYGMPVTFTATVTTNGANPPTNTVTFLDSTTPLGFATLSGGTAMFSPSSNLTDGTHTITAIYSGDANNATSTSPKLMQVIGQAATMTTLSVLSPAAVNKGSSGPVMITATVSSPSSGTPTGSVQFFVDGTALPTTASVNGGTATLNYNPSALLAGTHKIAGEYEGDTNFSGSPLSVSQTLSVQDFTIAANPTTVSVSAPGQSGSTTVTITPLGNFNQTLTYTCSGLPSDATCSFAAASATSETVTIQTMAATGMLKHPAERNSRLVYALLLPGLIGLLMLPGDGRRRWRPMRALSLVTALACLTLWMPACGGGSSGGGGGGNPGTPVGSTPVMITSATSGASALSHSVQVTLSVQ